MDFHLFDKSLNVYYSTLIVLSLAFFIVSVTEFQPAHLSDLIFFSSISVTLD